MCWNNEQGKHCGLVCSAHDKHFGRANLTNLGMTLREAKLFESYLVETENDSNPAYWPTWFRLRTNLVPSILTTPKIITSDAPVTSLILSPRCHNALRRNGIRTLKQLSVTSLYGIRNLGHKSIAEIRKALEEYSEQRSIQ